MVGIMNWKACERNFIRKVEVDLEKVESLKKMAKMRLRRARKTEVISENISFIVEDYYEVVKELLVAYLLNDGFRSKNHQCLISYFVRENPELEREGVLIRQMSFFRNRLGYYGEKIPEEFYNNKKKEFESLVGILLKLLEENK